MKATRGWKVVTCATATHSAQSFGCERFKRFSSWSSLRPAISSRITFIRKFKERNQEPVIPRPPPSATDLEQAGRAVIKAAHKEVFPTELKVMPSAEMEKSVPKTFKPVAAWSLGRFEWATPRRRPSWKLDARISRETPSHFTKRSSCIGVDHPPLPRKRPSPRTPHHERSSSLGRLLDFWSSSNDI